MATTFGTYQTYTSKRFASRPMLGKLVFRLFGYTNVGNFARSLVFRKAIKQIPIDSFSKVLDLGCGFGEYATFLAQRLPNATVTGLELHQRKIDLLEGIASKAGLSNLKSYLGYLDSMPQKDFDFIYSVDVFEHILEPEMPFKDAYEHLRPGGYLMVKMPSRNQHTIMPDAWFGEHDQWLDEEHIGQVYELDDLKARFEREGFNVVYAAYSDGWLARLGWEMSYFGNKAGSLVQLLFLPFAKLLVRLDHLTRKRKWGNAIQVIGQKPLA